MGLSQVNQLFDLMELFNQVPSSSAEEMVKDQKAVDSNYLSRGERILTLLREKIKTNPKRFKENSFFESLNFKTYSSYDDEKKLGYVLRKMREVIRPITNRLSEDSDLSELADLMPGFNLIESVKVAGEYERSVMKALLRTTDEIEVLEIRFNVTGWNVPVYIAKGDVNILSKTRGMCSVSLRRKRKYIYIADAPALFSAVCVFFQLRSLLWNKIGDLDENERYENPIYVFLQQWIDDALFDHKVKKDGVIYLDKQEADDHVIEFLDERFLTYVVVTPEMYKTWSYEERKDFSQRKSLKAVLFLEEQLDPEKLSLDFSARRTGGKSYQRVLDFSVPTDLIIKLLDHVFEEYVEDRRDNEIAKNMVSEYAKSFQTKHNIPLKILKAMEESPFNNYFGYVEYDEEVDIKKMEELYKQFEDVCKFVGLKMHDEVSLRFRKLGNHKASGLYYFFLKCLCVDVRCPSSFAHEMFHMIDYENGNLSRKAGFYYVSELYKRAFEEEVQKDSVLSKQLGGKTKYNREYYLQSSEIFARCGEIYLTRICGFDNSVVKPDTDQCGFAYPSDELLEQKIKEYFNKLFNKRTNEYRAAV